MSSENAPSAVRMSDYTALLRRQWAIILIGAIVGALLASVYAATAPREYTSATAVLVTASTTTAGTTAGRASNDINLDTEAQLVTSTETVAAAAQLLEGATSSDGLADRVTVTVPPNTDILTISFVGSTAQEAQDGARSFAYAYLDARRASTEAMLDAEFEALQERTDEVNAQLGEATAEAAVLPPGSVERRRAEDRAAALTSQLAGLGSQQNQVRASAVSPGRIVTQPALPTAPSSPDVAITVVAGALVGLLIGFGLAALRQRSDQRIHTADDLPRRAGVAVAAVLPTPVPKDGAQLVGPASADGRVYARLRNVVASHLEGHAHRVILVAGVRRGGGSVAANLTASLARAGEDAVLVCADVFGGTAAGVLGAAGSGVGMADVLAGSAKLEQAAHEVPGVPGMRVLGPGRDLFRADALLQSRDSRHLVERLQAEATYVVVELPATTEGTAAQTLIGACDVALLVVESDHTLASEVIDALGQIETASRPVLGAVVISVSDDPAADTTEPRRAAPKLDVATSGRPGRGAGGKQRSGRSPAAR